MGFPKKISQLPLNLNLKPEDLLVTVNENDVTSKIELTQVISFLTGSTNTFVTGGTYNDITKNIDFIGTDGFPPFSVSLSGISDTFVSGATLSGATLILSRTDDDEISVDLSSFTADTNTFITGTTLIGTQYTINENNGASYPTDFNPIVSGKVDTSLFDTYSANTQTEINNKLDTTVFNTYSGNTQTEINNKLNITTFDTYTANTVDNNTFITGTTLVGTEYTINENNGSAFTTNFESIVSGKVDTSLFDTYSANTQTEINNKLDTTVFNTYSGLTQTEINNKLDTSIFDTYTANTVDNNTFITGTTLVGTEYTINQNNGSAFTTNFESIVSGKVDTSLFDTYTGDTQTEINNKLDTTTFNSYSAITDMLIGTKLDTTVFNTYSGLTQTEINNKLNITTFDTYTANTSDNNTFITGTTLIGTEYTINENNGSAFTTNFDSIVSGKVDTSLFDTYTANTVDNNTFVNSGSANAGTQQLTFTNTTGGTFNVTNAAALFTDNDVNVTGGTYDNNTGCVTFRTNSGSTFPICGFVTGLTDTFVTGGTLSGTDLILEKSNGIDVNSIDLSTLISGKLDTTLFNTYSSTTQTEINNKLDTTTFDTYTANTSDNNTFITGTTLIGTQYTINENNGSAFTTNFESIVSGKVDTTLFDTYSGNTQTEINNKLDTSTFDTYTANTVDNNTFITGTTLVGTQYTINENNGSAFTTNFESIVSGKVDTTLFDTYSSTTQTEINNKLDTTTFDTYTANTVDNNTFITGTTLIGTEYTINENNGSAFTTNFESIVSGKVDTSLFDTYSSTTQTEINNKLDTTLFDTYTANTVDNNTFITGTTLIGTEYTINENNGSAFTTNFDSIVSGKVDTTLFDTYTANTIDNNTFVTGGTLSGATLVLDRTDDGKVSVNLSALSGGTGGGDINTGNVLWVDSIFGDDATALTNRQDKPYLTIEQALNDSTNGDTVIVRPGEYDEEELVVPQGVSLVSEGGWEVTIIGKAPATASRDIVELNQDSFIDGFSINVPQGSLNGIIASNSSGTSTANNITFYGNGGAGSSGTGLFKTGGGKLIGISIRVEGGGMSNCLKVDSGTLALEGVHVPQSTGDIDNVLLVTTSGGTNAGRAQMVGFNCGNTNVTNAIRTEGGSSGVIPVAKIFTPNIANSTNALSASGDYEEINLLGGSLENVTYSVKVDLTGTGIDASYRITSNHQPNYIYPPAVAYTAEFGLDFTQESTDVFNSSKNLFGLDQMSLGFAERGTEMNVGRGAPSTVGMKIFTTDNTASSVSDGGNFIDVTDDAESKEGSTITFQSGGTGTTILFTTRRVSSDLTTPLKFYGLDINVLQKKVGGDYVFEYWNGTEWKRDLWHIHSEDLGYSYGNDLFLRSQSNENISFELSKDSANLEPNNDPWSAKTINGVNGYWMRCRMISTGTTKPTIEQVKIIYDSSTISKEGVLSFNGRSLHKEEINLFMGTWSDPAADLANFSVTVGDGTGAETWTQQFLEAQFATNGDFGTFLMKIPQGISTSQRVKVKITYILSGTGDEDTPSEMRLSFLPVEVGNVLIADSDGGKTPIPRSPQNVTPFNTYPAEIVEIDTDFGENIVLQSTVGTFDISNYYEGDIILFRLEHIQATTINLISFDLEVSKWSLGKQAQPLVVDTQILLEEDWSDLGVANGWVFRQPSSTAGSPQNIWTVSSDTSRTGSNSAYISDETWAGGVPPYQYDETGDEINSYMYVDFDVPSSCIALTVSFYWTCVGESSFDYGMVGLAPTTFTPRDDGEEGDFEDYEMGGGTGNRLNTSYVAGATEGNWQLETISVPTTLWTPGEQARFMLRWRNDGTVGSQPPIAIDDITITSQFIVT